MKKICVYTCITGNYDDLQEVKNKEKNIDYLCFTNNKNIKSNTWKVIYIDQDGLDNQRLSRKIKMLGHPIISENYDISVWMDASVVFKRSIKDFVSTFLKKSSFAAFKHAYRNCIYKEAIGCVKTRKDSKENILKTVDFLRKENYPENNGLYEMTVFIKKHNDSKVIETMKLWFDMVCKYSKRDQLSFMYCVWKTGLKIDDIDLSVWDNDWFVAKKHNIKEKVTGYRIYYGDDMIDFDFDLDEQDDYKIEGCTYKIDTKIPADTDSIVIQLTDVPCMKYKNLKVSITGDYKIEYYNTISFNDEDIFYNDHGIIRLIGKFKKNQKLKISIELEKMIESEISELLDFVANANIEKSIEIKKLETEINLLKSEINNVLESKSWKITKPIRFVSNLSKRK